MIPLVTTVSLLIMILLHPFIKDLPMFIYLWVQFSTFVNITILIRFTIYYINFKEEEHEEK